jgi:hypothetical protein
MFNLGSTLDTAIALVVILLVLSLLVQAIQAFIKKIFKLKSKEIEKSLVELFKNIIDKPAQTATVPAPTAPVAVGGTEPPLQTVPVEDGASEPEATGGGEEAKTAPPATTPPLTPALTEGKPGQQKQTGKEAKEVEAKAFVKNVVDEFRNIGRYTKWGNPILDSISKEDLLKILAARLSQFLFRLHYKVQGHLRPDRAA